MIRKVKFYTLGCKTNQYETQAIRESIISKKRFEETPPSEKADIYIVNTCTVTAKADRNSRWTINHCHRENPNAKILVTGCLAELDDKMIKDLPGVFLIAKNRDKHRIKDFLNTTYDIRHTIYGRQDYTPLKISGFQNRTKAFIKIQDGCDNFCAYCKVPLARGRSRSRDVEGIVEEVARLLDSGFKELVLTGICLGDWGKGLEGDFKLPELLEKITKINRDFRVRLSSIEPNLIEDNLIEKVARDDKICNHLHIPLQSGSDKILKTMRRPYTANEYLRTIKKIRKAIPAISITSDVMVGFPGESLKDFNATVRLIKDIFPSRLHIFPYSKRRGTPAYILNDKLTPKEKKARREILVNLSEKLSYKYRRRFLGKTVSGLIEAKRDPGTDLLTGYTDTYIRFLLKGDDSLMGKITALKINKLAGKSTFCKHLSG
ncbi:MAG: tRNA (N(6)-L-threonylcarbamoyladenosine(37)-C(2))-methylthiotransferase MtaB [Candidatus Omnitrophica bacterium]|nr:tRNA (N(6)-L-threonylcarbamoyladenosine(37)-C(2))-methylthiotransferase MtaB [Candidatus Omnitrophota bacterium]